MNEYEGCYDFSNTFNHSYNYLAIYNDSLFSQRYIDETSSFIYLDNCKYCNSIADINDDSVRKSGYWALQVTAGFLKFDTSFKFSISNFETSIDPNVKYTVFGYACGRNHLNYILIAAMHVINNMCLKYNAEYNCITIVANRIVRDDYIAYKRANDVVNGAFGFPYPKAYTGIYDSRIIMSKKFIDDEVIKNINAYKNHGCMITKYSEINVPFIDLCIANYQYDPLKYKSSALPGPFSLSQILYNFSVYVNSAFKLKSCQTLSFRPLSQ